MSVLDHLLYGLAWLSFGLGHSWLAAASGKAWLRRWARAGARLAYNLIALVHLLVVWGIGQALGAGAAALTLPLWLHWGQTAALLGGLLLGIAALRSYDLGLFAGTRQLRAPAAFADSPNGPDEPLVTSGLHRYVRHPLYSAAFLLLFGLARDELSLATSLWAAAYFLLGTWFEEQKLLRDYGAGYGAYRRRVPAFIPWRGRAWNAPGD